MSKGRVIPKNIRDKVIERDGGGCKKCGFNFFGVYGLDIHHIIPFSECKENKINNLITLCKFCHVHCPYNKEDFHKWINSPLMNMDESKQSKINYLFIYDRIGFWYGVINCRAYNYTGKPVMSLGDFIDKIKYKGSHPPIISEELYNQVNN